MKTLSTLIIILLSQVTLIAQYSVVDVEYYTLDNGLKVYLNKDTTASQVYGIVAVNAGSKNDPADATGIAHYLEHLLFKGTNELGTSNFEMEKPHLDSINTFYDLMAKTTDENERKRLQTLINEQSLKASKYGLPNEFDKLIKGIGGTGVNAFTNSDQTVYLNGFPAEQMDKWLHLYSHRFMNPIFRSFQSELEVVYEEKNRAMDNMNRQFYDVFQKYMFKYHPYGTQTTLGSVEHLKNPSLTKMYKFFNTYYVSNNMALILSGNFEPDLVKPLIQKYFSQLKPGKVPSAPKYKETSFTKNEVIKKRMAPIKFELLGYKTVPETHKDKIVLDVVQALLYNESETGSLNKLSQKHKIMISGGIDFSYKEAGAIGIIVVPKLLGQTLKQAEKLVLNEIDKVIKGEFTDDQLQIIKTEIYRQHEKSLENYRSRTMYLVDCFRTGEDWQNSLDYSKKIDKVSKEDVVRVANKYLNAKHLIVKSRRGKPKKTVLKKPGFKPVIADQKKESDFAKEFKKVNIEPKKPRYIDLKNDVSQIKLNESHLLFVTKNPINDVFTLDLVFKVGSDSIPNLGFANSLSPFFYPSGQSLEEFKVAFAKLGLTYYSYQSRNSTTIRFTGLEKNLAASLSLINQLLSNPMASNSNLKTIKEEIKTTYKFDKNDPSTVGAALKEYVLYGKKSSFLNKPSLKEFKKLSTEDIIEDFLKATQYNANWYFVGKTDPDDVAKLIKSSFQLHNNQRKVAPNQRRVNPRKTNWVYYTNDKKAVQSHINVVIPSKRSQITIDNKVQISAFNQYMGGGFSGLILQEIREYRSLAYSAGGYLSSSYLSNQKANFYGYIGCQADKSTTAIGVMLNLLDSMPVKEERVETIQLALKNKAANTYPNFRYIDRWVNSVNEYGKWVILTPEEVAKYDELKFSDIADIYQGYIVGRPKIITISGNKKKMDTDAFTKFGKVKYVKKKDLFQK